MLDFLSNARSRLIFIATATSVTILSALIIYTVVVITKASVKIDRDQIISYVKKEIPSVKCEESAK